MGHLVYITGHYLHLRSIPHVIVSRFSEDPILVGCMTRISLVLCTQHKHSSSETTAYKAYHNQFCQDRIILPAESHCHIEIAKSVQASRMTADHSPIRQVPREPSKPAFQHPNLMMRDSSNAGTSSAGICKGGEIQKAQGGGHRHGLVFHQLPEVPPPQCRVKS